MVRTDTGTSTHYDNTPTDTTDSNYDEYEVYKTKCYENSFDEELLSQERIQSKQGWFVHKGTIIKNISIQKKIKRTIRNNLPVKIRIDEQK